MWVPVIPMVRAICPLPGSLFRGRGTSWGHRRGMYGEPEVDKNLRHDRGVPEESQHPPASATFAAPKGPRNNNSSDSLWAVARPYDVVPVPMKVVAFDVEAP
jgi:hypothetical protein